MALDFKKVPGLESVQIKEIKVGDKSITTMGPVTIPDPFDLKLAQGQFTVYDSKLKQMQKEAEKVKITSEASAAHATEMMGQANSLLKEIVKRRKFIVDDAYTFYKTVLGFSKPYEAALEKIVRTIKSVYSEWSLQMEMKRRKDEKTAQAAAAKLQKEINAEAKKDDIAPVTMPTPVLPQKQEPVRTASGTASTKFDWAFEVTDFAQLPDEYKLPNMQALRAAKKAGIKDIPGTGRTEKPVTSIRSR